VILLCGGFGLKNFDLIADFAEGVLIGPGAGLVAGSFIKKWYMHRAE
jgi:hypothetical protein